MNLNDIINDLESNEHPGANEIKAAVEKEQEKQKYSRGQIRLIKKTHERVTIMASHDSTVDVIYNKTGRKATLHKEETTDFER